MISNDDRRSRFWSGLAELSARKGNVIVNHSFGEGFSIYYSSEIVNAALRTALPTANDEGDPSLLNVKNRLVPQEDYVINPEREKTVGVIKKLLTQLLIAGAISDDEQKRIKGILDMKRS